MEDTEQAEGTEKDYCAFGAMSLDAPVRGAKR
jgi:hypothetical protein